MASGKVMTGARAQVLLVDPNTNEGRVVGIFNNISWGLVYGAEAISILGRYSPVEIAYTSQEAVSITASGWRVVDGGPHSIGKVPSLGDLLRHDYIEMAVFDRDTGKRIAKFHSVKPTGYNTSLVNKQPEEVSITFMALLVDDESTENAETPGASDFP